MRVVLADLPCNLTQAAVAARRGIRWRRALLGLVFAVLWVWGAW